MCEYEQEYISRGASCQKRRSAVVCDTIHLDALYAASFYKHLPFITLYAAPTRRISHYYMTHVSTILHALGFVESEIKTYLSSIELGAATVIELTKKTRLSRQATYVAIEALTERGLMASIVKGKKRYYVAEDPEKLASYAKRREQEMKEKLEDLNKILPELKLRAHGEKPIVKMFEGKEGIQAILTDIEQTKPKFAKEIIDLEARNAVISSEDVEPVFKMTQKVGTKVEGLYYGTPLREDATNTMRNFISKQKGGFKAGITLYGNKVAIFTFTGKMNSIMIESPEIAKTMGILFDQALHPDL